MLLLAPAALAAAVVLEVGGMDDDCCAQKVAAALQAVPFVAEVRTDTAEGRACATLASAGDAETLRAAVVAAGYTVAAAETVADCPGTLAPAAKDPWDDVAGIDAKVISRGETVDLDAHAVAGKFTVFDFGAPWCAPCHTTAATLKAYLRAHPDTAVRAVVLDKGDPEESYALPVVKQHLRFAEGLPWFLVRAPNGKKVYEGTDVDAALAAVDKKRK